MEDANKSVSVGMPQDAPITDVRKVPLGVLREDPDALQMATNLMARMEGPSYVAAAMFSSSI